MTPALFVLALVCTGAGAGAAPPAGGKAKKATPAEASPAAQAPAAEAAPTPPVDAPAHGAPAPSLTPASSGSPSGKPKLIVLDLAPGGGVEPAVASSLSEAVAAEVTRRGFFEATSQKDVSTLLGLERQKQLTGCSDEASSCMSELAGALGARFVLSGSLTRLGDAYQLNVQTLDSTRARPLGRSTRIARNLPGVRAQVPWAVAEATATPTPEPPSRVASLSLIGAGAAAVVGGAFLAVLGFNGETAVTKELQLARTHPELVLKPASAYRDEEETAQQEKLLGAGVAVAGAALVGLGLWLLPSAEESGGVATAVVPTPNGVAWVGVFP